MKETDLSESISHTDNISDAGDSKQDTPASGFFHRFRFQTILTISIVLVFTLAIGSTVYLSFQNSQYAVSDLAGQLQDTVADSINTHLNTYLETPHLINALCLDSITTGEIPVDDSVSLKRHFQELSYRFPTAESICFGNEKTGNYTIISSVGGKGLANGSDRFWSFSGPATNYTLFEFTINRQGEILEQTLNIADYDPRTRPWYKKAVQAGKPAWSDIYMWLEGVVSIDATVPVYSEHSQLLGVLDTSLTLTGIGEFLQEMNISPHGQAFIMDRDGMLIASSTIREPYIRSNGELVRLSALECTDPLVRNTAAYLKEKLGSSFTISEKLQMTPVIGGERHFVLVSPFKDAYGLDWLIVVIIPESDFMDKINQNTHLTIFLTILSIIATIIICVLLARWITTPIVSLNQSARALARGEWTSHPVIHRHDELGELAQSFGNMAEQLSTMFSSLKASEEQYISLFQSSADAILLFEGTSLIRINKAGEEMFSISQSQASGKSTRELLGEIGSSITGLIQSDTSSSTSGYREETLTRTVHGEARFLNIRITRIADQKRVLSLVHIRDITDQRRAIIAFAEQEALRESFSKIEMILQFLPDPSYVIDKNGDVLFWNKAMEQLTGLSSEKVIHQKDLHLFEDVKKSGKPGLIYLALHPEQEKEGIYPDIEHTGNVIRSSFWVEIQGEMKYLSSIAARLYDKNGEIAGAIESIRDITRFKENEEALLIANRKLGLLSSITRHDIQNKVMIAKSHIYLIREAHLVPDLKESVDAIERSMIAIEHFIAFTRTYQELGMKIPEWQNVQDNFKRAVEEIEAGDVLITIEDRIVDILADSLFGKVCYNLIENAIRHGQKLTRIDVTFYESDDGMKISVSDDGCGVPEELKEIIFERGYGKNTGFGLFLAREILSISSITITERGVENEGARFDIDIPKGKYRTDKKP